MKALLPLALALSACAHAQPPATPEPAGSACDAAALVQLIGRAWTDSLSADALHRSGARTVRVIRPGDAVTMDYRADRLNVHLTADGRVERFACG